MTGLITSELVRRAECRGYCTDTVTTLQVLGTAVDAGLIELGDLLDLVRSCSTADELGDALTMLAASDLIEVAWTSPRTITFWNSPDPSARRIQP